MPPQAPLPRTASGRILIASGLVAAGVLIEDPEVLEQIASVAHVTLWMTLVSS